MFPLHDPPNDGKTRAAPATVSGPFFLLRRLALLAGELLAKALCVVFLAERNFKSQTSRSRNDLEGGRLDFLAVEPRSDRIHC